MKTAYSTLLQHPNWFQKRNIILQRDGGMCRNCGSKNNLQVHHRQYHKKAKTGEFQLPWNYKNRFLVTLCDRCHEVGHSRYKVPTFII